jgi:hypothetical protein
MALLDLSLVTQALINLIQNGFSASETWDPTGSLNPPSVSPLPPDILKTESIGLYLYHVKEEAQYKNLPPPGNDNPPVRYTPLGVSLYFQMTAHSILQTDQAALNEQKMFGIAIKTLHDYPAIDDTTVITDLKGNKNIVFPLGLRDGQNRLRIMLQPVDHHEAITYWTAGSTPLRLAAYYTVSVVLIEPEESKSIAGRVLSYGVQTWLSGGPRIEGCNNTLNFQIPGKSETNTVVLSPAQVPFGKEVLFTGTGFSGDKTDLTLKNKQWTDEVSVDPSWELTVSDKGVSIKAQKSITDAEGNIVQILPGIYSAVVKITKKISQSEGSLIELENQSNECPFIISPAIESPADNIFQVPANSTLTIPGYEFPEEKAKEPLFPALDIYIGNRKLTGIKSSDALGAGEFKVVLNNVTNKKEINLKLPGNLDPAIVYFQLRIIINGAESSPNWIKINP